MRQTVGRWLIEHDLETTRRCFAQVPIGTGCTCNQCRNFDQAVDRAFPAEFQLLADTLGVDVAKPVELCHYYREPSGLWLTHGWFHFVGTILSGEDVMHWRNGTGTYRFEQLVPGFEFGFGANLDLVRDEFKPHPLVQLVFQTRVAWVLDEPEPEG